MRIRKGPRCVPLAPGAANRSFLLKGFVPGEDNNARREDDEKQCNGGVNQVVVEARGGGGAASVAATSGCHDYLDHCVSSSAGTMERLEVDRVLRKGLSANGFSRKRRSGGPISEPAGVISISSIIQAGVKSAKIEPVSAKSVVTSETPLAKSSTVDCSPAMKTIDQPTLLLQSLKRVCSVAEITGLTAKEAVAKIQEQGLPGLIDGVERLIVQVAKSFRSSSAFVEREERGRYFMLESSDLDQWDNFQTADNNCEEAAVEAKSAATELDSVIEAAKQLQQLQEPVKVEAQRGAYEQIWDKSLGVGIERQVGERHRESRAAVHPTENASVVARPVRTSLQSGRWQRLAMCSDGGIGVLFVQVSPGPNPQGRNSSKESAD